MLVRRPSWKTWLPYWQQLSSVLGLPKNALLNWCVTRKKRRSAQMNFVRLVP